MAVVAWFTCEKVCVRVSLHMIHIDAEEVNGILLKVFFEMKSKRLLFSIVK